MIFSVNSLTGKTAVIFGASRGIGLEIRNLFAYCGARVVSVSRSTPDNKSYGLLSCDVRDAEDVKNLAKNKFSFPVDILVNSAGITASGLLVRQPQEEITNILNTNLLGTVNVCKAFLPGMIKQKSGIKGNPGQCAYSASKAGVIGIFVLLKGGFTRSLALEYASCGIIANVIAPGFIDTKMTAGLDPQIKAQACERIAMKRFGTSEEIAHAALWLATSTYITGQVINVDGGFQ